MTRKKWTYIELGEVEYATAQSLQLDLIQARRQGRLARDLVLWLTHPKVFTLGRRGGREHLRVSESFLRQQGIGVRQSTRGGSITYHGPGQLVGYVLVVMDPLKMDVPAFVTALETVMLKTAADFGVKARKDPHNRGIWVGERKLGSIGLAITRGTSMHGFALNVDIDLTPFEWINPCGLVNVSMTSLQKESLRAIHLTSVRKSAQKYMASVFQVESEPMSEEQMKQILGGE